MIEGIKVDPRRVHIISDGTESSGPVVYWMSRDQRVRDNWSLLYAAEFADRKDVPLAVVFNLVPTFLGATARQYEFMLAGLRQVEQDLARKKIPFYLLTGAPETEIPRFVRKYEVSTLVTDFSPLRPGRSWKREVAGRIDIPFLEVDAHNIVPYRVASDKQEYGAYTIRPKIHRLLPEFLTEFPPLRSRKSLWPSRVPKIDWGRARKTIKVESKVPPVRWIKPGEKAARACLRRFVERRLGNYNDKSNDPNAEAESGLSPYIHFGQISAQRIAFEVQKYDTDIKSQEAFLEQIIVRRELADNFCYYNSRYDAFEGFPNWAQETLDRHRRDIRPYRYSLDEFEQGRTHDDLWNAAQLEMVHAGKMHNYLRMYWAKKILEWSPSPEEALVTAIYLNDRYQLDGRDPNGYTGIAWSIGGVHDRPWGERDIFGKIRYMSYDGCRRKFDVDAYIRAGNPEMGGTQ